MRFLLRLPIIHFFHERHLLFPIVVVLAVIGVLSQGALQPELPADEVQAAGLGEAVSRPARPDLEKTPLTYFSDYWNQLASNAGVSLTTIGPSGTPAILVGSRLAVTTVRPAREGLVARYRAMLVRPEDETADGGADAAVSAGETATPVEASEETRAAEEPDGGEVVEDEAAVESEGEPVEATEVEVSTGTAPESDEQADEVSDAEPPPADQTDEAEGDEGGAADGAASDAPDADPGPTGQGDEGDAASAEPPVEFGPYRLRAWDEDIGLALFDVVGEERQAFTLADPISLPSGAYVGAVTLDANDSPTITPGSLVTVRPGDGTGVGDDGALSVAIDLPADLSVAAIVDLDGSLVGLAYASPDGPRIITAPAMLGLIEDLQAAPVCQAIEVSDLSETVRDLLGVERGVLVEYVDAAAFEPEPLLQAGDILLEWGGEPVESNDRFRELYEGEPPGAIVSHRVLRGSRRLTGGAVMPDLDCQPVAHEPVWLRRFGLAAEWTLAGPEGGAGAAGWTVVAVAGDGPAAQAGVEEHDRLLAVAGQVLEQAPDRNVLEGVAESEEPLLLSVQRGGRTKLVAITPVAQDETPEPTVEAADDSASR